MQSEVTATPIVTYSHMFFLHLVPATSLLSFDWFTGLSISFVIGQSDNFGFGFTMLN